MKHLNGVEKLMIYFLVVAGTLKCHRTVALNMALASTTAMRLDSQKKKPRNGLDPAVKATALILAITLSKLKTHLVR